MSLKSYQDVHDNWMELVKECNIDRDDGPAMAESWNDYTDSICKDGDFTAKQYHFCPAWDDTMPDCDLTHVLEGLSLGVHQSRVFHTVGKPDQNIYAYKIKAWGDFEVYTLDASPDDSAVVKIFLDLEDGEIADTAIGSDLADDLRQLYDTFS